MNSLSQILKKGYERYKNECLYAHRLSNQLDVYENKYYSSFEDFLKKDCFCPAIIERYFTEDEIKEAKNRFYYLKLKVWQCILIYKYTNFYEKSDKHYIDDYFEKNCSSLYKNMDTMPIEDLDVIKMLVDYYDDKFCYIVLCREKTFVAEGLYSDLVDNGIDTRSNDE